MKSRAIKTGFMVFAALSVVSLFALKIKSADNLGPAAAVGDADDRPVKLAGKAPGFELESMAGGKLELAGLGEKWVILHFWATWCRSCISELPTLSALAREVGDSATVIAVSVDEGWEQVRAFFPHGPPPFAVLLDPKGKIAAGYGTTKFPETYLVDRGGDLRARFIGPRDWSNPGVLKVLKDLMGGYNE